MYEGTSSTYQYGQVIGHQQPDQIQWGDKWGVEKLMSKIIKRACHDATERRMTLSGFRHLL